MTDLSLFLDRAIDEWVAPLSNALSAVVFFPVRIGGAEMPIVVLWLISAGVLLTIALRFVNIREFHVGWRYVLGRSPSGARPAGDASHFQALAAALSGTLGLGNIAGVPVGIALGGPGAVFWMVVAGFFGMSLKFAECTLAVKYRRANRDGTVSGGPMYYIEAVFRRHGMGALGKVLAAFFALMAIGGSLSLFQINQAYVQLSTTTGVDAPLTFGIVMASLAALVIFGGIKSIVHVTSRLVPMMCVIYLGAAIVILVLHAHALPEVIAAILKGAFGFDAAAGGAAGAIINGLKRAAYSNEAGVGTSAIVHATVRTDNPLSEGYVALLEPFIDTVVICLMTGLVVLVTGAWLADVPMGIAMTSHAFASSLPWFPHVLTLCAILFAFSTVVSWAYYGSTCVGYLFGESKVVNDLYKALLCCVLSLGAALQLDTIVDFIDAMVFSMAVPNLLALGLLLPELRRDLNVYRATGRAPGFVAQDAHERERSSRPSARANADAAEEQSP